MMVKMGCHMNWLKVLAVPQSGLLFAFFSGRCNRAKTMMDAMRSTRSSMMTILFFEGKSKTSFGCKFDIANAENQ